VIGSTGCGALNFGGTHHKQPTPRRGLQPAVGEIIKPALMTRNYMSSVTVIFIFFERKASRELIYQITVLCGVM